MPRLITFLYVAAMAVQSVFAQEEVPEDVFNHASHELAFRVPPEFELVTQKRSYVNVAGQRTPRFQRIWQHGSDIIIVNIGVWPEAVWHLRTDKERFDLVLTGMQLAEPTTKVVSRRSYQQDGCPAESMTSFFAEPGGTSQRVDCFLSEPNVFMLGYASSKPSSWDDPASKAFFQSISLKPKK
jgi:hypothetical protein